MFSAVIGFVSTVISVVSAALPAVARFCVAVAPKIAAVITSPQVWEVIGKVISVVSQVLSIFRTDESVEDMGDRAMQAAEKEGLTPDSFDQWEDYADALRNFELDPVKSESYSTLDKTISGIAVALDGLERKFDVPAGTMGGLAMLVAQNPDYFTSERLLGILATTKDIGAIIDFFNGKLDASDGASVSEVLTKVDQGLNPGKDAASSKAEFHTVAEQFKHV